MKTIISTVGTSLLDNAKRPLGLGREDTIRVGQVEKHLDSTHAIEASAETNSLHRLGVIESGTDVRLLFLHSDTPGGLACGEALCDFYRGRVSHVQALSIGALSYHSADFKNRGLRALVSVLLQRIQAESRAGNAVAINATGGFKAQIAYAVLIGQVWQVPVYYIHEQFKDIVEMPPIPVAWDTSLFEENRAFFDWMLDDEGAGREPSEVESRLKGLDHPTREKLRLMVVEEGGKVALSPAGFVFYEAFEGREQQAVIQGDVILMSPSARNTLSATRGVSLDRVLGHLSRMRNPRSREAGNEDKHNSDLFFYPTGHTTSRIAFAPHPEQKNTILVYEVYSDHDTYNQALNNGYLWKSRYDIAEFTPWAPE